VWRTGVFRIHTDRAAGEGPGVEEGVCARGGEVIRRAALPDRVRFTARLRKRAGPRHRPPSEGDGLIRDTRYMPSSSGVRVCCVCVPS